MVKAKELRGKKKEELLKDLTTFRTELAQLRVAQVTGSTPAKIAKIRDVRKSIARALTVYNQTRKIEVRKSFAGKVHKPLDLRRKLTRAFRRRLRPSQAAALTTKRKKRLAHYSTRKYAIKS